MNAERRKFEHQTEIFKKFKEDVQKKQLATLQDSLKKDEAISKLKTQVSQVTKEGRQFRNETSIERRLQQNITINLSSVENSLCQTGIKACDTNRGLNTQRINGSESHNISNFEIPKCETPDDLNHNVTQENILLSINSPSQRNFFKPQADILSARNIKASASRLNFNHRGFESQLKSKGRHKPRYESNKENLQKKEDLQTDRGQHSAKKAGSILNISALAKQIVEIVAKTELTIKEEAGESRENFKNSCTTNDLDAYHSSDGHLESSKLKLSDLHSATKSYYDKHRELEDRTKQSELMAERMVLERDKLNVELDRLILELKQTKMELALSEERKEEIELALKNEIKFLISKILSVKGSNIQLSPKELSNFVKGGLNRSMGEGNSFMNNSGFLNQSCFGSTQLLGQMYSPIEHNNMSIIQNNLDKRSPQSQASLQWPKSDKKFLSKQNLSQIDGSPTDSPQKLNEFNNNENTVLKNIINTSLLQPKKLLHDFFSK